MGEGCSHRRFIVDHAIAHGFRSRRDELGFCSALLVASVSRVLTTAPSTRRTIRHSGYAISQIKRKRVEEIFGWMKTVSGLRKTRHRGGKL
jgi:hypothetical protein